MDRDVTGRTQRVSRAPSCAAILRIMATGKRVPLSKRVEADVLIRSRRRCALCFGLDGDSSEKRGQIAHIDRQRTNDDPDNLCYLCVQHHDEYDSKRSQTKGLTPAELRHYRDALFAFLMQRNAPAAAASVADTTADGLNHIILLPQEVAVILRCSESQVSQLLEAGAIAAFRVAGEWRVPSQAVLNYLTERVAADQLKLFSRNVLDPKTWAAVLDDMPDFRREVEQTVYEDNTFGAFLQQGLAELSAQRAAKKKLTERTSPAAGSLRATRQRAILKLKNFVRSARLPQHSWAKTFATVDPECLNLTRDQVIDRVFSTAKEEDLPIYLETAKRMYQFAPHETELSREFAEVCMAFGVRGAG